MPPGSGGTREKWGLPRGTRGSWPCLTGPLFTYLPLRKKALFPLSHLRFPRDRNSRGGCRAQPSPVEAKVSGLHAPGCLRGQPASLSHPLSYSGECSAFVCNFTFLKSSLLFTASVRSTNLPSASGPLHCIWMVGNVVFSREIEDP